MPAIRKVMPDSLRATWAAALVFTVFFASIAVDLHAQALMTAVLLTAMLTLRYAHKQELSANLRLKNFIRILFLLIGAFLTLRYFFWRTFNTIYYHDLFSFVAALALYAAEIYGIVIYLLSIFVNAKPLYRDPLPLPDDPQLWPTVDIFVPSYNENQALLENTLLAATQIRYPREKFNIYLLDDGGTEQKRFDPDTDKALSARQRHASLQELCERLGIYYLTRKRNEHAKAGNINAALPHTDGELILILDADHVPTVDILEQTVGWFLRDPKLFLVQTPHFFISPDPIEKNLGTFQRVPSESEMFYTVIQRGLDFWNASFFCGSAAVMRRSHLVEIGGISTSTVTEDAETSIALHNAGYNSAYLRRPVTSGLQPETFNGFVKQRVRWAQGMVQILMSRNPLRQKNLRIWQKLGYLSSSFFWFFAYARVIFILAPSAYLLFGLKIYDANLQEFSAYALPHIAGCFLVSNLLFGKVRWAFVSELYESMQSLFSLKGITRVLLNPASAQFNVTSKGERLESDFISSSAGPFYALLLVVVASLTAGIYRYQAFPAERDVILITTAWEIFNLFIIIGALGALLERRQQRATPRVAVDIEAELVIDKETFPCRIHDISTGGAGISLSTSDTDTARLEKGTHVTLVTHNHLLNKPTTFHARTTSAAAESGNSRKDFTLGVTFEPQSLEERAETVVLVYGDSERWRHHLSGRNKPRGIVSGAFMLLRMGTAQATRHIAVLFLATANNMSRRQPWLKRALAQSHAYFR